jgi:hypothetical protein
MLEICESFLSDVSAAREAIPEWKIDFGTLCSSSDQLVVKTKLRGACKEQRAHILKKYDTRIEQICDDIEIAYKGFPCEQAYCNTLFSSYADHPQCLKPKTNSSGGKWQSKWSKASGIDGIKSFVEPIGDVFSWTGKGIKASGKKVGGFFKGDGE